MSAQVTSPMRRVGVVAVLMLLLAAVAAAPAWAGKPAGAGGGHGGGGGGGGVVKLPNSMAAVGDSITRAFDVDWLHLLSDSPADSWSTGTTSSVDSQYLRILATNGKIRGHAYNDAQTGADSADLDAQLQTAAGQHVQYVTMLMGANDLCTSSTSTMTSTDTFTARVTVALQHFVAADPGAHIFVSSIPNIRQLHDLFANDSTAQFTWSTFGICQSALGPNADLDAVQLQEKADNAALANACANITTCKWDGGAVYSYQFTVPDVSTVDYFHPSRTGQAHLAQVTWTHGFWG